MAYHKQVSPAFLVTRNDINLFGFGNLLKDPKSVLASSHYPIPINNRHILNYFVLHSASSQMSQRPAFQLPDGSLYGSHVELQVQLQIR